MLLVMIMIFIFIMIIAMSETAISLYINYERKEESVFIAKMTKKIKKIIMRNKCL